MASTAAAALSALCFAQPWDVDIAKQCASLERRRGKDRTLGKKKETDGMESQTEKLRNRYRDTVKV